MARLAAGFGLVLLSMPLTAAGIALHNGIPEDTKGERTVVFFAGLEGSGHSYLEKIMGKAQIPVVDFPHEEFACGLEWNESGKDFVLEHLRKIPPGVYTFPTIRSYPECGIFPIRHYGRKWKYHPRMDWLKEVADKAGVHFRVIFMYRPMEESLASTCLNRIIENCVPQVDVLKTNAQILGQQLKALPPRDVQCLEYGNPHSMVQAVQATFSVQANISDEIIAGSFHEKRQKEDWAKEYPAWPSLRDAMVPEDSALKMLCRSLKVVNGEETAEPAVEVEQGQILEEKLHVEREEAEKEVPVEAETKAVESQAQEEPQGQTRGEMTQEQTGAEATQEEEEKLDPAARKKAKLDNMRKLLAAREQRGPGEEQAPAKAEGESPSKVEEEAPVKNENEDSEAKGETQKEKVVTKKHLGPIARSRAQKAAAEEAKKREQEAQAEERLLRQKEMEDEMNMPAEERFRVHKKRAEARAKREVERRVAEKLRKEA